MTRKLVTAVIIVMTMVLLLGVSHRGWIWFTAPWQAKKFLWNRPVFESYVAGIRDEGIRRRADGRGYELDSDLSSLGVDYIYTDGACVIFSFGNLPPDPIREVVFSPGGHAGLPVRQTDGSPRLVSRFEIAPQWFYVVRN